MKISLKIIHILIFIFIIGLEKLYADEKIKIGLLIPLSGEQSKVGKSVIQSIRLAINKIDNPNIQILPMDTKNDPLTTFKAAKNLKLKGVKIVIGPIFNKNLIYLDELKEMIFLSLTNKNINNPKNVISAGINANSQIRTIMKFKKMKDINRTIFLIPNLDFKEEIESAISESKIKLKYSYVYETNPTELTKQIEEITMYQQRKQNVMDEIKRLENSNEENKINPVSEYEMELWNILKNTGGVGKKIEPENIVYEYQYFFDNCTTRVRDYLDEALTGKIRTQFSNETSETFRDQVQAHYKSVGLISFSLDVLMNSNIDRNMTEWEDMFLPLRFRERLMEIRSDVAENGEQLMLLSDPQLIMEFPPPTSQSSPYQIVYLLFLLPMLFLALMLKRIPQSYFSTHSRIGFMFAGINFRIFGLICLLVSVLSGVYGILMLGSWFVSDHIDTHHNINLLLFWPTDILGILVALRLIFVSEPWPITHNSTPFINYYLLAHILGIFLYGIIALFELTTQSIGNIALHIVPTFLLFIF